MAPPSESEADSTSIGRYDPPNIPSFRIPSFLHPLIKRLYPAPTMQRSVEFLTKRIGWSLNEIQFGTYEPVIWPITEWPSKLAENWDKDVASARRHLAKIEVSREFCIEILDKIEPLPQKKLSLLDLAIKRCFREPAYREEKVGIPIIFDVGAKKKGTLDADKHDAVFRFVKPFPEPTDDRPIRPILLYIQIICPPDAVWRYQEVETSETP